MKGVEYFIQLITYMGFICSDDMHLKLGPHTEKNSQMSNYQTVHQILTTV